MWITLASISVSLVSCSHLRSNLLVSRRFIVNLIVSRHLVIDSSHQRWRLAPSSRVEVRNQGDRCFVLGDIIYTTSSTLDFFSLSIMTHIHQPSSPAFPFLLVGELERTIYPLHDGGYHEGISLLNLVTGSNYNTIIGTRKNAITFAPLGIPVF